MKKIVSRSCNHPTCGQICRRTKAPKKVYKLRRRVPVKKVSDKRKEINKIYAPASRKRREANPFCLIKIPGVCTNWTQGIHHPSGKVTTDLLLSAVVGNHIDGVPCCNACNGWIESNSKKAKEMGLKVPDYSSKLSNVKKI